MKAHETDDRQIVVQAAERQHRLAAGGTRERERFVSWLLESRRHVRNYLLLTAFDKELRRFDPQRKHDVEALLREASPLPLTLPLSHKREGDLLPPLSRRMWRWAPAAIVVAIALAGWWLEPSFIGRQTYATTVGEQRSVPLPDGSVVELNTDSRVQMQFSDRNRTVRLLGGEALFTVRPDPARPFRVDVGDSVIQALGTKFNVYRSDKSTTVSVVEGLVEVRPSGTRISAGEQARILTGNKIVRTSSADLTGTLAWRDRRLIFRNDRLSDIATEFNRYNRTQQIRVEGDAIRARRITGVFAADDPQLLVRFLAQDPNLTVERNDHEIAIHQR